MILVVVPVVEREFGFDFVFDVVGEAEEEVETGDFFNVVDRHCVVFHISRGRGVGVDESYSSWILGVGCEYYFEECRWDFYLSVSDSFVEVFVVYWSCDYD